jgi:signal transduction histidine kinase
VSVASAAVERDREPASSARPLRVLIVEDDEGDTILLLRELRRGGYDVKYERVQTREAMRAALETGTWDLVLSDFSMPHFSAPEALALVGRMDKDLPFIIVSGTIGEETAVESMRAGARDFVVKDKLMRLLPAIGRELHEAELRRQQRSDRQRAEEEREGLLAELRAAVQARDTFLSIASHELRTPLTSLQLTVQVLERAHHRGTLGSTPAASLGTSVEVIARQAARLGVLVESLLDVTRITANCMKLSREPMDLAEVAAKMVSHAGILALQAETELVLHAESAVGNWDRFRVETVISNLLSNAIKFGAGKPVEVSVAASGGVARLAVTDRGAGISPEDQARIFEKFERAVPERHYGGFGLGLWISRQIVEAHHGTIQVTSAPGKGSTFVVELPMVDPSGATEAGDPPRDG